MNSDEAAAALAEVGRTEQKLGERACWPFHRHAMFGLSEGLLVAGIAQPTGMMAGMAAVAMSLLAVCIMDDRHRHGMFISGFQPGATRPLTILLFLFLLAMLAASLWIRDGDTVQPLGYLMGAITFAVCTVGSLRWQKIYQTKLARRRRR